MDLSLSHNSPADECELLDVEHLELRVDVPGCSEAEHRVDVGRGEAVQQGGEPVLVAGGQRLLGPRLAVPRPFQQIRVADL